MQTQQQANKWMIVALQAVFGYEWLMSGLDKILSGQFVSGLHANMQSMIPTLSSPLYADFLRRYCLAHCVFLGYTIEYGELFLGISFFTLAFFVLKSPSVLMTRIGMAVSLLAAVFNFNFFFYQNGHAFLNPGDPFDEGLPIDFVMALLQVALFFYYAANAGWFEKFRAKFQSRKLAS